MKTKRVLRLLRWRSTQAALIASLVVPCLAPLNAGAQSPAPGPAGTSSAPAGTPSGSPQTSTERPNDYPTLARVEYVFDCLNENRGPRHEMVYKCVCAADRVAEAVPYDRWVDLSTFFNAQPMAGERGAYVRERTDIQAQLKSYRELQLQAKKACFIPTDPK